MDSFEPSCHFGSNNVLAGRHASIGRQWLVASDWWLASFTRHLPHTTHHEPQFTAFERRVSPAESDECCRWSRRRLSPAPRDEIRRRSERWVSPGTVDFGKPFQADSGLGSARRARCHLYPAWRIRERLFPRATNSSPWTPSRLRISFA
jgi:hypothetical protein